MNMHKTLGLKINRTAFKISALCSSACSHQSHLAVLSEARAGPVGPATSTCPQRLLTGPSPTAHTTKRGVQKMAAERDQGGRAGGLRNAKAAPHRAACSVEDGAAANRGSVRAHVVRPGHRKWAARRGQIRARRL